MIGIDKSKVSKTEKKMQEKKLVLRLIVFVLCVLYTCDNKTDGSSNYISIRTNIVENKTSSIVRLGYCRYEESFGTALCQVRNNLII